MNSPESRIRRNLSAFREDLSVSLELCLLSAAQAGERAAAAYLTQTPRDPAVLRRALSDFLSGNNTEAGLFERNLSLLLQLSFCRSVMASAPEILTAFLQYPQKSGPSKSARLIFPDNSFSNQALKQFAPLLHGVTVNRTDDFARVAEAMNDGDADFGILPIEDSEEGNLRRFSEQISRYELHISHTCQVLYPDRDRSVRFALLYRTVSPEGDVSGKEILSCALTEEDGHSLSDLLAAALECGLTLHRLDAIPSPYGEDGFFYHATFRINKAQRELFEIYLALCLPRAAVTQHYLDI